MNENKDAHDRQTADVKEEVVIVILPDTGSYPRTVMIESLNASVALVAMHASRGPKNHTFFAEFYLEGMRHRWKEISYLFVLHFAVLVFLVEWNLTEFSEFVSWLNCG